MPKQAEEQEGQEQQDQAQQQGQQQVDQQSQQTIDWEADDNPYKKRYGDSQGQITPLVRTLNQFAEYDHNTKTWKQKTQVSQPNHQQDDDVEKILEGYDPEFRKSLGGYVSRQISTALSKFQESQGMMAEYNSGITSARNQAIQEFGDEFEFAKNGKFNVDSPLYKLANEILTSKYAQFNPDGTFHKYTSADSEYMATVEAYAILSKRTKQASSQTDNKGKMGAIQGKGTKAGGIKKALSYEEYSKLSNEQKDAYDLQQTG